jgi:hypothetical protein
MIRPYKLYLVLIPHCASMYFIYEDKNQRFCNFCFIHHILKHGDIHVTVGHCKLKALRKFNICIIAQRSLVLYC